MTLRGDGGHEITLPASAGELTVPVSKLDLKAAESRGKYVAIYLIWEEGGQQTMLGKTTSPDQVPSLAQRYNWREVRTQLLWTAGDEIADRILAVMRRELAGVQLRAGANWYDLDHRTIENALTAVAKTAGIRFFSTEERTLRFQSAVTDYVESRQHGAKVIPFKK
jgi:hypothetical protein